MIVGGESYSVEIVPVKFLAGNCNLEGRVHLCARDGDKRRPRVKGELEADREET